MNFAGFIKTILPVKIPNITALSNISFATILTNIFCTTEAPFLFSYFVNLDKKELQNSIIWLQKEKIYRD